MSGQITEGMTTRTSAGGPRGARACFCATAPHATLIVIRNGFTEFVLWSCLGHQITFDVRSTSVGGLGGARGVRAVTAARRFFSLLCAMPVVTARSARTLVALRVTKRATARQISVNPADAWRPDSRQGGDGSSDPAKS